MGWMGLGEDERILVRKGRRGEEVLVVLVKEGLEGRGRVR